MGSAGKLEGPQRGLDCEGSDEARVWGLEVTRSVLCRDGMEQTFRSSQAEADRRTSAWGGVCGRLCHVLGAWSLSPRFIMSRLSRLLWRELGTQVYVPSNGIVVNILPASPERSEL